MSLRSALSSGEPVPGLPEIVPHVLAGMETYDSPIPMKEMARISAVEQTPLMSVVRHLLRN